MKNLILTGGMYHPFTEAAQTLAGVLDKVGIASAVTDDLDAGFERLAQEDFDLLTVYCLRWTMPQEKFADARGQWASPLSDASRQAVTAHLKKGRGILALHTAAVSFDDWPGWREAVGAGWTWGHSFHPPLGEVHVRPTPERHPIVAHTPAFTLRDEAYTHMDRLPDLQPLLEVRADSQSEYSPCLWVREHGGGRIVYDALGHDSASLLQPQHQAIVQRSALWLTGQPL